MKIVIHKVENGYLVYEDRQFSNKTFIATDLDHAFKLAKHIERVAEAERQALTQEKQAKSST